MRAHQLVIAALSVALGVCLSLLAFRPGATPTRAAQQGLGTTAGAEPSCAEGCDGGECVLGRCIASGACTRNSDCDDGNACSAEWCVNGACVGGPRPGACLVPGLDAGVCEVGFCERPVGEACTGDADCGPAANACLERACVEGRCARGAREDGSDCATPIGRGGTCAAGACVATSGERRLRFTLEPEQVARLEHDLETRLANNLRYDLKAVLVGLEGGGYNLVLHNRRSRAEVRGLCDPSFIAFDLADYTAATNWKSANLQVWLEAGRSGWAVPTRGSRFAVDQGRANSLLGALGVVDVRTLRIWLERAFTPLDGVGDAGAPLTGLEAPHAIAPLPARADAGTDAGAGGTGAGPATGAAKPGLTGKQALARAWDAFGEGRLSEAKRWLDAAKAQGVRDPDLDELLRQ